MEQYRIIKPIKMEGIKTIIDYTETLLRGNHDSAQKLYGATFSPLEESTKTGGIQIGGHISGEDAVVKGVGTTYISGEEEVVIKLLIPDGEKFSGMYAKGLLRKGLTGNVDNSTEKI